LDSDWHGAVQPAEGIVFVAAGVFYYFEAAQVRRSLGALAKAFPGAEMVFDVCSPLGLKIANKRVIQDGGMDESSFLKWGVENARTIAGWDAGIEVMEVYPMFRGLKRRFSLRNMYGAFLSDALGIMSMVHLRLQAPSPREN